MKTKIVMQCFYTEVQIGRESVAAIDYNGDDYKVTNAFGRTVAVRKSMRGAMNYIHKHSDRLRDDARFENKLRAGAEQAGTSTV